MSCKLIQMQAYADANFSDCKGSLTTCGYVIQLVGDAISWRTHKQPRVALSTCQAEHVIMSEMCQALLAICQSIKLMIDRNWYPLRMYCDSKSAIAYAKTNGNNKLMHIIERKEHYVRVCVNFNLVKLVWVPFKEQIAYMLTKPLTCEIHRY